MPDYCLYLLTAGDCVDWAIVLTCDGDDQATAEMEIHTATADGAQLWLGWRWVPGIATLSPAA